MLKKGSAPVTAYKTGVETVLLGRKVCGDEGENIQWDTVYTNKRVPPLANIRRRYRDTLIKLRNVVEGEPTEEVSTSFPSFKVPRLSPR